MPELSSETEIRRSIDRFRWSIAVYATVAISVAFIVIEFSKGWDLDGFFFILLATPIVVLCMLIVGGVKAFQRRFRMSLSFIVAAVAYCAASWLLLKFSTDLHAEILWALHSKEYKAEVLAEQDGPGLKHIDWFGWGFAGGGTDMYLAYDPTNSLSHKDAHTGRFGSLLCDEVWKVHRMQDKWYAVTFNTNEVWDDNCDTAQLSPQSPANSH